MLGGHTPSFPSRVIASSLLRNGRRKCVTTLVPISTRSFLSSDIKYENINTMRSEFRPISSSTRRRHFSSAGPKQAYENLLSSGKINKDPRQEKIVEELEKLHHVIKTYSPVEVSVPTPAGSSTGSKDSGGAGGGFFGSLFGGGSTNTS